MKKVIIFRGMGVAMTLAMALSQLPKVAFAAAEDGLCEHHPAHTADCGYAESGECTHSCQLDNGCITLSCAHTHVATCFDLEGNSLCRHDCAKDEACGKEVTDCLHTSHSGCGHAEGENCEFAENGCEECEKEAALTTIIGTDVIIKGYKFPYTGEEIRPEITVTVGGTQLKSEEHYTLTYENNVEPGTASVTVTGVKEAGYTGIVTIEFTIEKTEEETKPEETQPEETQPEETEPEQTKPVEHTIIKGNGVKWYQGSGKNLTFSLSAEGITGVSVNGKALTKDDFTASGKTLTISKSYLNKLTVGKYNVTVQFADGEAKGNFTVSNDLDTTNPVTADQNNIGLWLTVTAASLAALAGAAYVMGRKKV